MTRFKLCSGVVLAALLFFPLANAVAQNASPVDLTILRMNAPLVPAPSGFPPFPARVDLPVYLSKDEPADDYFNASTTAASPDRTGLGNNSQPHAALAQSMLAARNVVSAFE